jgi:tripartite-type tricarboxylate transporter receptor subunit TctC
MLKSAIAAFVLAFLAGSAVAQSYPSKPVTLVIPFPPGGVNDVVGRIVATKLATELGQPVVIENKSGASGVIGTELVARAQADGYTIIMGNISTFGINPATFAKLPYDPLKSFAPITMLTVQPLVIAVHPSSPAQNLADLIKMAKAKPKKLTYGTAGSSIHLAVELFSSLAGIQMTHVPYKGSGPATTDLVGGHIDVLFDPVSSLYPHVKAGKVRGLAISSLHRYEAAPELPTVIESGFPRFDIGSWQGLLVPAGTPPAVIDRLYKATVKVLEMPDIKAQLLKQGAQASPSTPQQFEQHIGTEIARWKKVASDISLKPE